MDVGKVNVSIRKPKNVTQEGSERGRERNMLHERENNNQALHKVDFTLQSGFGPGSPKSSKHNRNSEGR